MSEYTVSYCDCCMSDYFGGHHLPVVQVAVDGATTLRQLKDELHSYWAYAHIEEDSRFIGGFDHVSYREAVERLFHRNKFDELAFPELEVPGEDDDWEMCYAYFVIEVEYEDYESSEVVIPVDDYIVECSLDWVKHNGEWYLADANHFSCFLKGRELTEQRMWSLPAGLKQKATETIRAMEAELKKALLTE